MSITKQVQEMIMPLATVGSALKNITMITNKKFGSFKKYYIAISCQSFVL